VACGLLVLELYLYLSFLLFNCISFVLDRMYILMIQSIRPIKIRPIRPEDILIKRLKPNQILILQRNKVLNQISPLRLIHHIHFVAIHHLTLQLFHPDHLRIVSLAMHIKLEVLLLAFELVAINKVMTLLLDFGDTLLFLLLDQLPQFLFLLFVRRHGLRVVGLAIMNCK
jgi:hypothetical protein